MPSRSSAATTPSARLGLVAEKLGRADFSRTPNQTVSVAASPEPVHDARAVSRWCSMAALKAGEIDADAARPQRVLGEIERKPESVVKREGDLALEPVALLERSGLFIQDGKTALERLAKARLLELAGSR